MVRLVETEGTNAAIDLLHEVFNTIKAMNPSKNANAYWQAVNRTMLQYGDPIGELWKTEKIATIESLAISKEIALTYYSSQREAILKLSRNEAIEQLIDMHNIDSRIEIVGAVSDKQIMNID